MAESYRSSGTFAPAVKFADPAFDVVAEIIKQVPDDGQSLYDAVQAVVGENAWDLLAPKIPPGRRVPKNHWLCQILAEAAAGLDELGDIGGSTQDAVREGCMDAGWGVLRSQAAGLVAGQLVHATLGPALTPLTLVSMKLRLVALMFCPDSSKHPALENACARQVLGALGLPTGGTVDPPAAGAA
ncbi:hypothetical protein [Kribbella solani]|uniref:hypothetical protein n=1 Tax=Kribbella solani TaxID=236067 RepID=UPI0029B57470|nr:hypothetical protein [Kribbella solani]MDX2971087.1 hypothetical protein [Kribbella solani]